MSTYIYSGEDVYRQETALASLLKKNGIDQEHTVMMDASSQKTFRIESALMECDSFSLFDENRKAVILKEPFFLSASTKKNARKAVSKKKKEEPEDRNLALLEQYMKNPNSNTLLVFYCHTFNADSRKKIYKMLTKYGAETVYFKKMDDEAFRNYAKEQLKKNDLKLSRDAFEELLTRVSLDTLLLHNAVEKMVLYGEHDLKLNDVQHLVSINPDVDVFKLTSCFTAGNLEGSLEAVQEMLTAGYDYTVLISMLAKRLRTIYCMRLLYEQGLDEDQIAACMHAVRGYVWHVLKDSYGLSSERILVFLNELASIDQGIKQGILVPKDSFEQFLLKYAERSDGVNARR